jgi:hypothetical protein
VADLARRLQDRVDGQEALLDRVADLAQRSDDRARMSELRDATRRRPSRSPSRPDSSSSPANAIR